MPTGSRLALLALLALLVAGPVAAQPATGSGVAESAAPPATTQVAAETVDSPSTSSPIVTPERGDRDVPGGLSAIAQPIVRDETQLALAGDGFSHSNTSLRVQLTPEGDADWQIVARFNLTTDAQQDSFRDLGSAFRAGDVEAAWLPAFRQASQQARSTTGRDMQLRDVERAWDVQERATGNATGVLRLSFTWTNFARVEQDQQRLVVNDAFQTRSGSWLSLVEDQTLVVAPPEGYTPVTGSGDLQEQSFYWNGPQRFDSEVPSAVFAGGGGGLSTLMIASLVVATVVVLVLLVYLLATRRGLIAGVGGDETGDGTGGTADASAGDGVEAGGAAGAAGEAAGAEAASDDDIDVELLSDEERVERLLERNGGRMKQASIVKETGWSNAKVSQLLSSMEEADRIDKLRIGRENLISFPDEDVADIED